MKKNSIIVKDKIQYLIDYLIDLGFEESCNRAGKTVMTTQVFVTTLMKDNYKINIYNSLKNSSILAKYGDFDVNQENYMIFIIPEYKWFSSAPQDSEIILINEKNGIEKIEKILEKDPIFKSYYRNAKIDKLL